MSDMPITSAKSPAKEAVAETTARFLTNRQRRKFNEVLLAYILLLPTIVIIGLFGLFPLVFSAYQSTLRGLNRIVGRYDGLGNYVRAFDNLAYVLFFWITAFFLYLGIRRIVDTIRTAQEHNEKPTWWALPGFFTGLGVALIFRFTFVLLPVLLGIPEIMRDKQQASGEALSRGLFLETLGESLREPTVTSAFWVLVITLLVGVALAGVVWRIKGSSIHNTDYYSGFVVATFLLIVSIYLGGLTWVEIQAAYAEAIAEGESLAIWSQIVTISAGFILIGLSWVLWTSASDRDSNVKIFLRLAGTTVLIIGGWVLIAELPVIISAGDEDWWLGLLATTYYSLGTIPFQLILSLILATLLFQNINGKSLFRMIYFLPYITPFVATAAVFRVFFSGRPDGPVNSIITGFGIEPLGWLNEPTGIFQMLAAEGTELGQLASGPSLALVVIILYGIWTYVGFDTVIFLAGLGNIPRELYEAASIDGAGRWEQFRHITLPLLSPTIYFLSLWATIGTFKAFNHIWVLREGAALGTTDTASVVIFEAFRRDTRIGYASALAILLLLVILILTFVNNRVASRRVFYG